MLRRETQRGRSAVFFLHFFSFLSLFSLACTAQAALPRGCMRSLFIGRTFFPSFFLSNLFCSVQTNGVRGGRWGTDFPLSSFLLTRALCLAGWADRNGARMHGGREGGRQ